MDLEDFRQLAEDATRHFRDAAFAIMKREKSTKPVASTRLAGFGSRMHIIHNTLTNPTPEQESIISNRVLKLLVLLEELYAVGSSLELEQVASFTHAVKGKAQSNFPPENPRFWYPNLRNLSSAKTYQHYLETVLVEFATSKQKTVEKFFSRLDTLDNEGGSRKKHEGHLQIEDLKGELEEQVLWMADPAGGDQSHINQALYEALCCPCTCPSTTRQGFICSRHWTRIQLYDSIAASRDTDTAIFDVVFSSTAVLYPNADVKWQQLRFEIPKFAKRNVSTEQKVESHPNDPSGLKAPYKSFPLAQEETDNPFPLPPRNMKEVRFDESISCATANQQITPEEPRYPLQAEDFCQLLGEDLFGETRKRLKIESGVLHQMHDPAEPDPNICNSPSMPLSEILNTREISSKNKIVLAYILARATWQYYASELMRVCWSSGSIHFIPEEPLPLDTDDGGDLTKLDPSKPYFAFQFDGADDPASIEFCDSRNVLHRYPRILALSILLTELGYPKGKFKRKTARNLQEQINNDWKTVQRSLHSERWPKFGFHNPRIADTYRIVVSKCLDHTAFHVSSFPGGQMDSTPVEQRRAILYKNVVYPLYQLLSESGSLEEHTEPCWKGEVRSEKAGDSLPPTFPHSSARSRPLCTEYTVGWICAVQVEKVAACELLDEEYASPASSPAHDNNIYEFGRIGQHKVVIASLPKGRYGIAFAATAARDMLRSFPSIKVGLMVGIAGGAPSARHDVRLGDIVVSSPDSDKCSGGVVHYDFGKAIQSRDFQRTGSQNGPPIFLLNAVNSLSASHERNGHKIEHTADWVIQRNPRLKLRYQRPGPETDRLYQAAYLHKDATKCCEEACDRGKTMLQIRPHRDETCKTVIHHGLIASADKLMKDAQVRDALAEKEGILCFEMEAAGLMDHFPCLVIRGICDYSDTHKNDAWQGYAAIAAAAYAKELLEIIPRTEVEPSQVSSTASCV